MGDEIASDRDETGLLWEPHDPTWLVELAGQKPNHPWLADPFRACTTGAWRRGLMLYFVDPVRANRPGSAWQFEGNLTIVDPTEGTLIVDVLTGHRIGGIEFYDRLFTGGEAGHVNALIRRT